MGRVLSRDELGAIDAYWRAGNYLPAGQIYARYAATTPAFVPRLRRTTQRQRA